MVDLTFLQSGVAKIIGIALFLAGGVFVISRLFKLGSGTGGVVGPEKPKPPEPEPETPPGPRPPKPPIDPPLAAVLPEPWPPKRPKPME